MLQKFKISSAKRRCTMCIIPYNAIRFVLIHMYYVYHSIQRYTVCSHSHVLCVSFHTTLHGLFSFTCTMCIIPYNATWFVLIHMYYVYHSIQRYMVCSHSHVLCVSFHTTLHGLFSFTFTFCDKYEHICLTSHMNGRSVVLFLFSGRAVYVTLTGSTVQHGAFPVTRYD